MVQHIVVFRSAFSGCYPVCFLWLLSGLVSLVVIRSALSGCYPVCFLWLLSGLLSLVVCRLVLASVRPFTFSVFYFFQPLKVDLC